MTADTVASSVPVIGRMTIHELWSALKAGVWDFRTAPQFGMAFSTFYVLGGLLLLWVGAGTILWTLALALGFPLIAPFLAVGLYDVSRRIEADEPLVWREILGAVWRERNRHIPRFGGVLLLIFLMWGIFAHMIFVGFLGILALESVSSSWDVLWTPDGLVMLTVQVLIGAGFALLTFGLTVVSLPLLVDTKIDVVTAMQISLRTVAANKTVMALWGLFIAVTVILAMIPMFFGLLVVLPILGHATWHIYRRALYHPIPNEKGAAIPATP